MSFHKAPNGNNTCAVIVTYFPDKNLISLIETIRKEIEFIIIIDNTDQFIDNDIFKIISNKNILVIKNIKNSGIARALNDGFKKAKEFSFDWVLTFDQDTILLSHFFIEIKNIYSKFPLKSKIGAIGLSANSKKIKLTKSDYIIKDYLITSGCLIPMSVFDTVGEFSDELFIDNVDIDYCLRIRSLKFLLVKILYKSMIHKAGNNISKKILFFNLNSSNHNHHRRYYMARNHILICKRYFNKFPFFIFKLTFFFTKSLLIMVLIEDKKVMKLSQTFLGLKDGFNNKTI
jgi:rhamnosyltransferase